MMDELRPVYETEGNDIEGTKTEGYDTANDTSIHRGITNKTGGAIIDEVSKVIIGQIAFVEKLTVLLMTGGHSLIEGVPGLGKTLSARMLAKAVQLDFRRIQFTPDLMPADVTGTKVFDLKTGEFFTRKGPVFTNILLADEINRTPPKTQAALLECMEENRVTLDGETHSLGDIFMVLATQNPLEYEGTYPLPEAQLDRFMMKLKVGFIHPDLENSLLERFAQGFDSKKDATIDIQQVCGLEDIQKCRAEISKVTIKTELIQYITAIVRATRNSQEVVLGASPRAAIALLLCSKTLAALRGRDFVIPEDIKYLCQDILAHRMVLRPEAMMEGRQAENIIERILNNIEVPR